MCTLLSVLSVPVFLVYQHGHVITRDRFDVFFKKYVSYCSLSTLLSYQNSAHALSAILSFTAVSAGPSVSDSSNLTVSISKSRRCLLFRETLCMCLPLNETWQQSTSRFLTHCSLWNSSNTGEASKPGPANLNDSFLIYASKTGGEQQGIFFIWNPASGSLSLLKMSAS